MRSKEEIFSRIAKLEILDDANNQVIEDLIKRIKKLEKKVNELCKQSKTLESD